MPTSYSPLVRKELSTGGPLGASLLTVRSSDSGDGIDSPKPFSVAVEDDDDEDNAASLPPAVRWSAAIFVAAPRSAAPADDAHRATSSKPKPTLPPSAVRGADPTRSCCCCLCLTSARTLFAFTARSATPHATTRLRHRKIDEDDALFHRRIVICIEPYFLSASLSWNHHHHLSRTRRSVVLLASSHHRGVEHRHRCSNRVRA